MSSFGEGFWRGAGLTAGFLVTVGVVTLFAGMLGYRAHEMQRTSVLRTMI